MTADFDIAATSYDKDFTLSHIGSMQRDRVWKLLDNISAGQSLNILELNCGTGEDAIRLAGQNHSVLASDISEEMLEAARAKKGSSSVHFKQIDINEIESHSFDRQFDLVFSNFGGLNCINTTAMTNLAHSLTKITRPSGKFVAVIMPEICIWETCYFLLRGNVKDAFRRRKGYALANVSGKNVKTWYYSPKIHQSLVGDRWSVEKTRPIGLFIPPSYLEKFFSKRLNVLNLFWLLEKFLANYSWQAKLSDHYYIEYSLK